MRRIVVALVIGGVLLVSAAALGLWRPDLGEKLLGKFPRLTALLATKPGEPEPQALRASEPEEELSLPPEEAEAGTPMPGTRAESGGASVSRPAPEERPAQRESPPRRPLAEIYASMRPHEAASVLSRLEPKFAAQILKEMAPRKAARVLEAIEPGRAATLTSELRETSKEPTP